ncbi:MAG: hypothetical protein DRJ42_02005 [Deltaproteobacteria bacterium]|nr:MAG: hypothetical protein DRJ42_02005 [Deltaproteobacteria bacterium]
MTPSAGLLWALAFLVAGALAYWDYAQSSADLTTPQQPPSQDDGQEAGQDVAQDVAEDVAEDVEIEVIYGG